MNPQHTLCKRMNAAGAPNSELQRCTKQLCTKAVNRGDKRSRQYRDRHFAKFERSRRYRDRYRC
jgi:hypothetical protein